MWVWFLSRVWISLRNIIRYTLYRYNVCLFILCAKRIILHKGVQYLPFLLLNILFKKVAIMKYTYLIITCTNTSCDQITSALFRFSKISFYTYSLYLLFNKTAAYKKNSLFDKHQDWNRYFFGFVCNNNCNLHRMNKIK